MKIDENNLIKEIQTIRTEIGHENSEINIKKIIYNQNMNKLLIITFDRPDKSVIIGKGGWVVGKLKEKLQINTIHVESYTDIMVQKYRMELTLQKLEKIVKIPEYTKKNYLQNLKKLLENKLKYLKLFDFEEYFNENNHGSNNNIESVVALSGGLDSSFSLILAKYLGFNPIAITVDPGTIILPPFFKKNIELLTRRLDVPQKYLNIDANEIIENSLNGKYHPCGRCSKYIDQTIEDYAIKNNMSVIISGDLLTTGSQSISVHKHFIKINLPALLNVSKHELEKFDEKYGIKKNKYFGCPLLIETIKKYPYMKKYSIQRILRETRSGALEPGQALDQIQSITKKLKY